MVNPISEVPIFIFELLRLAAVLFCAAFLHFCTNARLFVLHYYYNKHTNTGANHGMVK